MPTFKGLLLAIATTAALLTPATAPCTGSCVEVITTLPCVGGCIHTAEAAVRVL